MKRFKNILVGVDLADDEQLVANKLSDATSTAIDNGIWLAKHNDAELVFFNALEVPAYASSVAEEQGDIESTLIADCEDRLTAITQQAKAEGIDAGQVLVFGKSSVNSSQPKKRTYARGIIISVQNFRLQRTLRRIGMRLLLIL